MHCLEAQVGLDVTAKIVKELTQEEPISNHGKSVGLLDGVYSHGSALMLDTEFEWPVEDAMVEGWFDSLPYPMDDMRPQGFLGRSFARRNAGVLQVPEDPTKWHDDDILYALSAMGDTRPAITFSARPPTSVSSPKTRHF